MIGNREKPVFAQIRSISAGVTPGVTDTTSASGTITDATTVVSKSSAEVIR